ncbi:MAG: hypothetical protein MUQ25_20315 [Candidatus Aminicenantes bacterium]|nr:hypothetical protein [Candidatus Aminicenantes bacterium]TFG55450.1 MAG: hypothetical protein E4H35_05955 [Candidatus Aminicenantes bacterium]
MEGKLTRTIRRAGSAAALVLVFAATWTLLDRTEHRPGWLTVEAPAAAVVGQPLEIRVKLDKTVEATLISCTLHRAGTDRKIRGYLASSGPARKAGGGETYAFVFEVPEREGMAFASAIIFLSPTGEWPDGTRAVSTKLMPVKRNGPATENPGLKKTRVYHFSTAAESAASKAAERGPRRGPSPWAHPVIFVILLSSAALCRAKAGRKSPDTPPEEMKERSIWLAFAAVFVLGAFLELSGVVGHLAAWGRRLAEAGNVYDLRKPLQKAIMAAVAASALGLFLLFLRALKKPGSHLLLWWVGIGLAAYLSASFISVLSFHAVDVVRGMTWHGLSPVDAVRGAGALVALLASVFALRRKNGTQPG